jgi:uncharacterized protein YwqG
MIERSMLEMLEAKIGEYHLTDYRTQILENALECFFMESTEPDDYREVGNSRLGGLPDLPDDLEWLTDEGEHFIFLGQINLRDIQGINPNVPKQGILYLFLGNNEQAGDVQGSILFCPDASQARKGKLPDDYNPMYEDEDNIETPHRVDFTKQLSLPGYGHALLETMGLEDDDAGEHLDAYLKMVRSIEQSDRYSHQIFGHIHYINDDPRKYAAEKFEQTEWLFLMHLGFDKKVGFCFWDAGDLLFLVEKQSLQAGNFNKVFSCIETT